MLSEKPAAIGVFDSGYGGLTILKEFLRLMPAYDFIYLGDNARSPYGTRSFETVYHYTLEALQSLFSMDCHLVILACNTASAKALRTIQQRDLPGIDPERRVLGVIRPTAELVGNFSQTGHVGVLGTPGTVASQSYPIEIQKLHPHLKVSQQECPMWVPLVENDEMNNPGADYFIRKDIRQLLSQDPEIDSIILGCTHYPLLLPTIRKFIPRGVSLLSQDRIVAESLVDYLHRHPEMDKKCLKNGEITFFTTDDPILFNTRGSIFFQKEIAARHLEIKPL
jgi:glutamate racemase